MPSSSYNELSSAALVCELEAKDVSNTVGTDILEAILVRSASGCRKPDAIQPRTSMARRVLAICHRYKDLRTSTLSEFSIQIVRYLDTESL